MGTPMALNLRRRLPRTIPFHIYDVDQNAMESFIAKAREFVELKEGEMEDSWIMRAENARDVGEKSVRPFSHSLRSQTIMDLTGYRIHDCS